MTIILVMETTSSCNSDYRYLLSTINYYYRSRQFGIGKIYAGSKSSLTKKDAQIKKEINSHTDESKVILCADYDDEFDPLNKEITNYCKNNGYELIWMNKNIENVYVGIKKAKNKNKISQDFLKKSDRFFRTADNLSEENPLIFEGTSNILVILNKYLPKK